MTATIPDVDLQDLEFAPEQPCEINRCWTHADSAFPGVALLVCTMTCCTLSAPVCAPHVPVVTGWIVRGFSVSCDRHGGTATGCDMRLVPIR